MKNCQEYSKTIEFKLDTQDQKLTAVRAQGEVFASRGGVDLMITEFVENAFDAIKKKKILHALPEAIKQMNFTPQFEKIAIEKYTTPITEFQKKYSLTEEDKSNFGKLQEKLLDSLQSGALDLESRSTGAHCGPPAPRFSPDPRSGA